MHHPDPGLVFAPGEQPDKVLYQKSLNEIAHSRYEVGRLTLQTLINTYPDSEFLSKAKLAIADSYYNEGGVSGLTQSEAEYKDFITFFPTAPEAPQAAYRVGMAHFRMMAKSDRDQTEALEADAEFKEFLLKYPDSPLISRVKRRLRQAQEVLAQGEFLTAYFYYSHGAYPASQSRFQEIIEKYPNFSGGDQALFYLGESLEHMKKQRDSIPYYSHVITDFPLSPLAPQAKTRLTALKVPIPKPTRAMLARAQADASHRVDTSWMARMQQIMSSAPDTSSTLYGPVHLGKQGSGIEMAKAPEPVVPAANASIVATPLNEKSEEPSKPAETPANSTAPSNNTSTAAPGAKPAENGQSTTQSSTSSDQSNNQPTQPPAKKKSHFHVLKKIVDPF